MPPFLQKCTMVLLQTKPQNIVKPQKPQMNYSLTIVAQKTNNKTKKYYTTQFTQLE